MGHADRMHVPMADQHHRRLFARLFLAGGPVKHSRLNAFGPEPAVFNGGENMSSPARRDNWPLHRTGRRSRSSSSCAPAPHDALARRHAARGGAVTIHSGAVTMRSCTASNSIAPGAALARGRVKSGEPNSGTLRPRHRRTGQSNLPLRNTYRTLVRTCSSSTDPSAPPSRANPGSV